MYAEPSPRRLHAICCNGCVTKQGYWRQLWWPARQRWVFVREFQSESRWAETFYSLKTLTVKHLRTWRWPVKQLFRRWFEKIWSSEACKDSLKSQKTDAWYFLQFHWYCQLILAEEQRFQSWNSILAVWSLCQSFFDKNDPSLLFLWCF